MISRMLLALSVVVAAAVPWSAGMAQDSPIVVTARQAGLIGERYDGYLGAVGALSAIQRSQVATVNIKRRKLYSDFAARHGVSPREVGITAGCTLLSRVDANQFYLLSDDQWRRRAPGQPAPRPPYCG